MIILAVGLIRGKEGIQSFELPKPKIQSPTDVLVRVIEVGINGTDYSIVQENEFDMPPGEDTMTLGHETVGMVEEIGPEVGTLKEGDLVVPTVRRGCGLCAPCLHGRSDMCQTGLYTERGIHKRHGYFTEYFVDDEEYIVKVPEGVEPLAVLTEPLSIAEKAISEIKYIQAPAFWSCSHPDHSMESEGWGNCKVGLVVGAGPLGFLSTGVLRLNGIHTYVAEIVSEDTPKVQLVKEFRAHYVNVKDRGADDVIRETGNLDIIIEASGASELALNLTVGLARNGICVLTGIPRGRREVCLDGNLMARTLVKENQVVMGSVNSSRQHFILALDDLRSLRENYGPTMQKVISHRYPLADFKRVFEHREPGEIKSVFEVSEMGAIREAA
ncbi:MAG TPA: glucose 1-dehydrogenase [Anaerolineae bacterium]|nr:glucose 1-dehydrogenase [Anaerolineae bacterium]